jgi:hypothetical protein
VGVSWPVVSQTPPAPYAPGWSAAAVAIQRSTWGAGRAEVE